MAQDGEPMHAIVPGLDGAVVLRADPYNLIVVDAGDATGNGSSSRIPIRHYARTPAGFVNGDGTTAFYQSIVKDYELDCLNSKVRITGSRFVGFNGETLESLPSDYESQWRRVFSEGDDEGSLAFQIACENYIPARLIVRADTVEELVARYYEAMDSRNYYEAQRTGALTPVL